MFAQEGNSEAFRLFAVPPSRRSGGDGGVVISDAAAQRRRSLMGTGLNIGGGEMSDSDMYNMVLDRGPMGVREMSDSDMYNSEESSDDNSSGFGESGSFHVRFSLRRP